MKSEQQQIEIINRVKLTIELFLENDTISDAALSRLLIFRGIKTSSSTVGRDLSGPIAKALLGDLKYKELMLKRYKNKIIGKQKGGINSIKNNDFLKDEKGKFNGCKKIG